MAGSSDITRAIDGAYNGVESFVRGVGAVLGVDVDKPQPGEGSGAVAGISTQTIATMPAPSPVSTLPAPRVLALPAPASSPSYYVIPLRDADGSIKYAVTDGRSGVLAPTREVADKLLEMLAAGQGNGKAA